MARTRDFYQSLRRSQLLLSFSGTDRRRALGPIAPSPAPDIVPPRSRAAGVAVDSAFGPRLSRLAGARLGRRGRSRSPRSRIRWSTGWRGARSAWASARSSPARRAPRSTATARPTKSTPRSSPGAPEPTSARAHAPGSASFPARTARARPFVAPPDRCRPNSTAGSRRPMPPIIAAIERGLDRLAIAHGGAILLDCHSMPQRRGQAELVIGDRHGTSAGRCRHRGRRTDRPRRRLVGGAQYALMRAAMSSSATAIPRPTSTRSSSRFDRRILSWRRRLAPRVPASTAPRACSRRWRLG